MTESEGCRFDIELNVTICFTKQNKKIIDAAQDAYTEVMGAAFLVVITGGLEGKHGADSQHYKNGALDFRTGHTWQPPLMSREQALAIVHGMQRRLGMDYDVVLEEPTPKKPYAQPHIHAEFDPKRGQPSAKAKAA